MPHFITEFSKGLDEKVDMQQVVQTCFDEAEKSQMFDMASVESRAFEVPYAVNAGGKVDFIHVKLALFPGREEAKLAALSKAVCQAIAAQVTLKCTISVQVADINPKTCFQN